MARDTDNTAMNIMVGFVFGAAAGIAAGMLLAPKSGPETRHLIADKTHETIDKAGNLAKDTANQTKEKLTQVANKTKSAVKEGQRAAREA